MNHELVSALIDEWIQQLKQRPYDALVELMGQPQTRTATLKDGNCCMLRAEVFWDGERGGDIRVFVSADDGRWRAFRALTSEFIMMPDGCVVGESLVAH